MIKNYLNLPMDFPLNSHDMVIGFGHPCAPQASVVEFPAVTFTTFFVPYLRHIKGILDITVSLNMDSFRHILYFN